jgi:hypothetical protein
MEPLVNLNLQAKLEELVDLHGMYQVLNALAKVADAKAEHIATNWQDIPHSKQWAHTAQAIDHVKEKFTRSML